MSDNKDNNQDFIEENDPLAEALDDNFSDHDLPEDLSDSNLNDDVIDVDMTSDVDMDGLDQIDDIDEWSEDFSEEEWADSSDEQADMSGKQSMLTSPSGEKNWFNIIIFGVVGIFACFMMYSYLPGIFGFGGSSNQGNGTPVASQQTQPQSQNAMSNVTPQVDTSENNQDLAQQALSGDAVLIEKAGGLLSNPELLGDGVASVERDDPDAQGNAIFEALNNTPDSEAEVMNADDIFQAFEQDTNIDSQEVANTSGLSDLPQAADEVTELDDQVAFDNVFENIPRTPSNENTADDNAVASQTGVASLANAPGVNEMEQEQLTDPAPVQAVESDELETVSVNSEQLEAVNSQINAIMSRLDDLASKIDAMDQNNESNAQAEVNNATVAALQETISGLEKRISVLSKAQEKASVTVKKRTQTQPTVKKSTPKRQTKSVAKKTPTWTLRGASPGQAYVAEKGTRNIQNISVGDRLDGIGRIRSIAMEQGRWIVRGTSGVIRQ